MQPFIHQLNYQPSNKLFAHFADWPWAVYLDSAMVQEPFGRYSFIGIDPFLKIVSKDSQILINDQKIEETNPWETLRDYLTEYKLETEPLLPPFQGGAMGYFSYDLCHQLEYFAQRAKDDMEFPDMAVGFYDLVIAIDEVLKQAWIFSSGFPEKENKARTQRARARIDWLLKELEKESEENIHLPQAKDKILSNFTEIDYETAVDKVRNYIYAGDIFQANISQRFVAKLSETISNFSLYTQLRSLNPAPFSAFMNFESICIASASPERFLKLNSNKVETRPIKGTQKRDKNPIIDKQLADELRHSEKDQSENIMIVDLMRNDLSKVCLPSSVAVPQLCQLETYPSVHHLVSVVTGQLIPNYTAIDLLKATFPGGSVTGAPKIRAMEIIAEIEPTCRGPYCGSLGYIGFNGDMDLSIIIRTFVIKDKTVTFQAGGAIVADSNSKEEYQETLIKAAALIKAYHEV